MSSSRAALRAPALRFASPRASARAAPPALLRAAATSAPVSTPTASHSRRTRPPLRVDVPVPPSPTAPYPRNAPPPAYIEGPWPVANFDHGPDAVDPGMYTPLPRHQKLADGTPDYVRMILNSDIYSLARETPLTRSPGLSTKYGCNILLKREDLQPVFSFKLRGAYNMMRQLSPEQKARGVVTASAGNHAQGVAMSGRHLGIPATIYMPKGTPKIKHANVSRLGAKVVLHGDDFDEAKRECARVAAEQGMTNVPPFDEPRVIAGQGTIAVEIGRQVDLENVRAVFVSVGGGGLLAGVAAYLKRVGPPGLKVIGVETFDADAGCRSLQAGRRVTLDEVGLFADGTAVKILGSETYRVASELVDGMVRVDNDAICAAIKDVFEATRAIPEPSGALSVAGMKQYLDLHPELQGSGASFVSVVSGANINLDRMRFVSERAQLGERREAFLHVEIPEQPGKFLELYKHFYPRPFTEFSYRHGGGDSKTAHIFLSFYLSSTAPPVPTTAPATGATTDAPESSEGADAPAPPQPPKEAQGTAVDRSRVEAGLPLQLPGQAELNEIISNVRSSGFHVDDLSGNELAKAHMRYLVGGRSRVPNERLFRFEFPEKPGALNKFLTTLRAGWNVSLFHYRAEGGDIGYVLAGLQVPQAEEQEFNDWLTELGYAFQEETDNEVYQRFLSNE